MCFPALTAALNSDSVYGPLALWPSLHNAYAHFLDSWHQAEVGGSPRLKLLPHRMHVSFRNDSRGAMEASVRIVTTKYLLLLISLFRCRACGHDGPWGYILRPVPPRAKKMSFPCPVPTLMYLGPCGLNGLWGVGS